MQNLRSRLLFALPLAIGLLVVSASSAWAQTHCVSLKGTVTAAFTGTAWVGTTTWNFGNGPTLTATIIDINTGMKPGKDPTTPGTNVWIGTETSTLDFGNGDTFQLITRFVTQHMNDPFGLYRVNENGTIANGTGKYSKVHEHFTVHGPFGPGLSKDGTGTWLWTSEYNGNICGLD